MTLANHPILRPTNGTGVRPTIKPLGRPAAAKDPPSTKADTLSSQKQVAAAPPSPETPPTTSLSEILAMIGDYSGKAWPLAADYERCLIRVIDWISEYYADQKPPAEVLKRLNAVCPKRDNPAIRDRLRIRGLLLSE